jgi:hypothetical protein
MAPPIVFNKYGGSEDGDPEEFLDAQEALWAMYRVPPEHFLTQLEQSVTKAAKVFVQSFIRRYGRHGDGWDLFCRQFVDRFRSQTTATERWLQMARRTQGEGESVEAYVTEKEALLRKCSQNLADADICSAIVEGFRADLAAQLRLVPFDSVNRLLTTAKNLESSGKSAPKQVKIAPETAEKPKFTESDVLDLISKLKLNTAGTVNAVSQESS